MRLGIDFGTCFSSAAFMSGGLPTPVRIDYNATSLPSSVYLTEADELLVGQDAEDHALDDPSRLRRELKRDLGNDVPYRLGNRRLLPEDLVALILGTLKKKAEEQIARGELLVRAALTVPASYEACRRGLMEKAARQAGFEDVELLHEPVAAGLYFGYWAREKQTLQDGNVFLVYDLGGGTFDVALIQRRGATFETMALPSGSDQLGGRRFDDLILEDLRRRASPALARRLNSGADDRTPAGQLSFLRTALRVRDDCRRLKHQLTSSQQGRIFFVEPSAESYTLSRADFEGLIAPIVAETLDLCRKLLESSGVDRRELTGALLVGGSCRIPYIQNAVAQALGCPAFLVNDPALAVCLGASLHGAALDAAEAREANGGPEPGSRAAWADRYRVGDDPFKLFSSYEPTI